MLIIKKNVHHIIESLILLGLVALYLWNLVNRFWLLPCHRDSVEYLGPAMFGTTWGGYWPWLDRLTLAVALRLFSFLTPIFSLPRYLAGPIYITFVNIAILVIAIVWAYRKSGFLAAFLVGVFINVSYHVLIWGTPIYPDQTVALYSLITFIFFFSTYPKSKLYRPVLFAGFFLALTCFSKIIGISVLAFFLSYITYYRSWDKLKELLLGFILGTVVVSGLYVLLYNYQSLIYTFKEFFVSNIETNINYIGEQYLSYLDIVLNLKFFPLVALLIAIGAYRKDTTRNLFWVAWANIIFLYIFAAYANYGTGTNGRNIYTAYVFTTIGLSIYLADVFESVESHRFARLLPNKTIAYVIFGLATILLIIFGFNIGISYNPVQYTPTKFPAYIKWFYILGPLLLVGLLVMISFIKSKVAILLFILMAAIWNPAYNGGLAYDYEKLLQGYCNFFFNAASALKEVPVEKYGIYVNGFKQVQHDERIVWVYKYYLDEKYPKKAGFDGLQKYNQLIKENIQYLSGEAALKGVKGNYVLTDSKSIVAQYYPQAREVKEIYWSGGMLSLMELVPER